MGRTYLFECARCGYRAHVAGGTDRGFHLAVQTIQCLECRELHDAVTELKVPVTPAAQLARWQIKFSRLDAVPAPPVPPRFPAVLNRLLFATGRHFRWVRYPAACPVSPRHRVQHWQHPGKCPKCGLFLEGNALPYRLWD
jgi:hypothetical protein